MTVNFQDVLKLNLPVGSYAIFGSGPMAVRGIREANDIDLVVPQKLWDEYAKKYPENIKKGYDLNVDGISLIADWKPYITDTAPLINNPDIIHGLPFVKLDYLILFKRALGREKDIADLKLIEAYLANGAR